MSVCARPDCGEKPLALGLCPPHYYHQKHMKREYGGFTWGDFDSMQAAQGGLCALCGQEPERWHVDHDHESGLVRALLCHRCNVGLGWFDDDPESLRRAADYLEAHAVRAAL